MKPAASDIVNALHDAKGNLSVAARKLGVSRQTLYTWLEKDDTLRTELEHAREQICDCAEEVLFQHLQQGSLKAATFVLTHIGRKKDLNSEKDTSKSYTIDFEYLQNSVPASPDCEDEYDGDVVTEKEIQAA